MKCVDGLLKWAFGKLGRQIGLTPGLFLFAPILITIFAAQGFKYFTDNQDPSDLFMPENAPSKVAGTLYWSLFAPNMHDFDPTRVAADAKGGYLLITAKDDESMLRKEIMDELTALDVIIKNIRIAWSGRTLQYQDMCATTRNGQCLTNNILQLGASISDIEAGNMSLTWPIWKSGETEIDFRYWAGGVKRQDNSSITSIKVIRLQYILRTIGGSHEDMYSHWEQTFIEQMGFREWAHIKPTYYTSWSLFYELQNNMTSVIPYASVGLIVMIVFCIVSCMASDWVKSKPLLGVCSVFSTSMALITGFGVVFYYGVPFTGIVVAAVFLLLGIGMDDTFIMLAAWRRTSPHDDVPTRMSNCFKESAVSITITSITDMMSFWTGLISPFPCVVLFCKFTATCIVFTYLYQITFFGACMAICGYMEKGNRHTITCGRVISRSKSKKRFFLYRWFCSGGISEEDSISKTDENCIMLFFRDYIGAALHKKPVKFLVLVLFGIYIGTSVYGLSKLEQGMDRKKLATFDSYVNDFYDLVDSYMSEYLINIQVMIVGPLDYSDPDIQNEVEDVLRKLAQPALIDAEQTQSWLREFKRQTNETILSKDEFKQGVQLMMATSEKPYYQDILMYDLLGTGEPQVVATRYVLQTLNVTDEHDQKRLIKYFRDVCDSSPLNVTTFATAYYLIDQYFVAMPSTIQCIVTASIVMMIVSVIFIPSLMSSVWVAFSIASIEVGVMGFMALWNVHLDSISMILLIMSIGFSVDFSVHMTYHFISSDAVTPKEKLADSLSAMGLPILQSGISTILGVIGLAFAPSYIFVTFFKLIFLVITLGALHGLILLPVLLSLTTSCPPTTNGKYSALCVDDGSDSDVHLIGEKKIED